MSKILNLEGGTSKLTHDFDLYLVKRIVEPSIGSRDKLVDFALGQADSFGTARLWIPEDFARLDELTPVN